MRLLPAVLAAAFLLGPAPYAAADDLCVLLKPCLPPAAYSSGRYLAPPRLKIVNLRALQKICSEGGPHVEGIGGALGCAIFKRNACVVVLPREIRGRSPALFSLIERHELGHCRGWVHDEE